ncbi:MAG TPA: hypothetical protein VLC79_02090, partial [Cellvibrio sp.]|nr:hypothetical protein [Cellvibrio sp.]
MSNTSRVNKYARILAPVNPTLLSAVLALVLLFFFTSLALRHIHTTQEQLIREHLENSLNSFTELIKLWQQQNIAAIQMLVNSPQGKTLLK